jgi:septum site-determining protein MinD
MIGFIASKSRRAEMNQEPVLQRLVVTRYDPERASKEESLSLDDISELLGLPLLGVIPESKAVLTSTNIGQPVILAQDPAGEAYSDFVKRFLGQEVPMRFTVYENKSFLSRIFGQ